MTKVQKITLSPSRDIPFNKLVLSQSNVRRVKAGVSIEQLAESIAQRTLLQSLNVRAVVDGEGNETGMFEVPAGGRRYRALELLVKQKRMAKTQAVPCVVREGGIAEDDSLAENDERVGLHPLDQFRAFKTLNDAGLSEEDIAARHFVTPAIVKQRLRLASVSPRLHEIYAEDGMTLEQLMAFSVTAPFSEDFQHIDFGNWAEIHVYLPHPEVDSSITPPFMEAFLELQKQLYQLAAQASSGSPDSGQLSDEIKRRLQISVVVSGGSSDYVTKFAKPAEELLKAMVGKMTGRQAAVVILGVVFLIGTGWSFSAWLEQRKTVQIEELRSGDHVEA